ncbi:MAG: nucleotidyltransferase family protein [Myxococcales bacterium]
MLADEFGATRVVLFGSHARGHATETSDVDLLVYGVPLKQLVNATARASRLLGVRVDVIPADLTQSLIREPAEAEGKVLFERTSPRG